MKISSSKELNWIALTAIGLLLMFLPLSISIDFMQNDDWNRYKTVASFLTGNFRLLDVTATTFYTQGFIGMVFAKIFLIKNLPVLTLVFGCLNFFLFTLIVYRFFNQKRPQAILVGLILFFNPIHFYSLFGFMTEVYLLTFCLASIYFYLHETKTRAFIFANLFWIFGFFAKQWAVVFPTAFLGQLILRRKWKTALIQLAILLSVLAYYFLFFPQTNEMTDQKSFEPRNFTSVKYMFTHAYAYFIYLAVFSLPFMWSLIAGRISKAQIIMGVLLAWFAKFLFDKTAYPWKNFPLYPNIFTDKGFFLNGIEGETYPGIYSGLIYLLDEIGLISLVLLAIGLIVKKLKDALNFESISILIGYFLIVGTPFVFDRYILVFVPVMILFLLRMSKYKFNLWIAAVYLLIQTVISIDYGLEYVNRQQLIWNHANRIYYTEDVPKNKIIASHAWNKYYQADPNEAVYWFRYAERGDNGNEKVAREFWSRGIFMRTNLDIIRIEDRN